MHQAVDTIIRRFGMRADVFDRLDFFVHEDGLWVGTREAIRFSELPALRRGLKLGRIFERTVKPTTNGMQVFGISCRKNRLELTLEPAKAFVAGEDIEITDSRLEDGFVVAFYRRFPLGVGLYKSELGTLKSQIPRSRRLLETT